MYDIDETAIRFSNYLHVLRELVHLSCGHLALEPRFEVKALLGDHLHDDARAVSKLLRRLYELRTLSEYPGAPSDELAALLDRAAAAGTAEYLQIAYGELKPTLIAAFRIHLAGLDPVIDEPSLRLLTQLLHRQDRHVAELPAAREHVAFEDLGALPLALGEVRGLRVLPPVDRPARDDFVEVADRVPGDGDEQRYLHDLMHAELCAAELTARSSHEHPEMPWEFHVDMARQTWDGIRHAEIADRLMATELGCHWGDFPVDLGAFRSMYAHDLPGRLALVDGERPAPVRTALPETVARALDYVQAEAATHADTGARWGTYLRESG